MIGLTEQTQPEQYGFVAAVCYCVLFIFSFLVLQLLYVLFLYTVCCMYSLTDGYSVVKNNFPLR